MKEVPKDDVNLNNWMSITQLEQEFGEDAEEMVEDMRKADLMQAIKVENTPYYALTDKFVYLKRHGMSIEEILERADDFSPDKVADKLTEARKIGDKADDENRELTQEEKQRIKEIFADPYVRAFVEKEMGSGFELRFDFIDL